MNIRRIDGRFVRLRTWAVGVTLALAGSFAADVQAQAASERQVKAAFLYRFIEYVRWPESVLPRPDSPIVIGVLSDPAMVAEVQAVVMGRSLRGHPLVVRAVREAELAGISGVHVLFLGEQVNNRLQRIIRGVEGAVLVVSEAEDGLAHGSVINFVIADRRVRFEVALMPAAARSLGIGSGLLSVAINVRKDSRLRETSEFLAYGPESLGSWSPACCEGARTEAKAMRHPGPTR